MRTTYPDACVGVVDSKQAVKDSKKIELSNLKPTVKHLIEIIKNYSFENPSPYEKLVGDLKLLFVKLARQFTTRTL